MRRSFDIPWPVAWPSDWSPDGSRFSYLTIQGTVLVDIEIEESVTLDSRYLDWSPDESQLTYVTFRAARPYLWLAVEDDSDPRLVGESQLAAWSPDGTQIAILDVHAPNEPALKTYDVATQETTTLVTRSRLRDLHGEYDFGPFGPLLWSPGGGWIGFGIDQSGENESVEGIALVHPDGSDLPRQLAFPPFVLINIY